MTTLTETDFPYRGIVVKLTGEPLNGKFEFVHVKTLNVG